MKQLTNVEDINKLLRAQLITQSGINGQLVRDATTEYGAFLDVNTAGSIFKTLSPSKSLLLFEVDSRTSEADVSQTNEDDTITYTKAYRMKVILYGDNTSTIANNIIARFRTEKVRNALLAEGVHIETISEVTELHEFKNNIVWLRNDFSIDIACEMTIVQTSTDNSYELINNLIIRRS